MRTTTLGELEVSVLGLGCMGMSQSYGEADPAESERTLHRALDIGVTLLDTANVYGRGHNEELLGRVLRERRSEYVLATKFGILADEGGIRGVDGHPDRVEARCDESLTRLRTDVIDLYYLHRADPEVPIEDTVGAMARLVATGKVRYLGLSEVSAETLRRAHAVHPIAAVQSEYSLWTRDPENEVLPTCRELGVGFVPFSPLGRAMLTGSIDSADDVSDDADFRRTMPRFQGENFERNLELVAALGHMAEDKGCTPGQLALAWLLARGEHIVPIPGTKRVRYLEENSAAADVELAPSDVARLEELFAPEKVQGERYPPEVMKRLAMDKE